MSEIRQTWKARLGVSVAMLTLAFLGLVVTDVKSTGGWDYWKWIIPIYALLALWLSWYIKRQKETLSPITLGHELLHWFGLIATVFLVSMFVKQGIVSRYAAGLFDLSLLALGVFMAGIYIEWTFLATGLVLGVMAFLSSFIVQYLFAFIIPLLIAGAIITALTLWISHRKTNTL